MGEYSAVMGSWGKLSCLRGSRPIFLLCLEGLQKPFSPFDFRKIWAALSLFPKTYARKSEMSRARNSGIFGKSGCNGKVAQNTFTNGTANCNRKSHRTF